MYTALKETESRATDLVPLWKVPLLCHVIPRQRRAAAAVALIRRTTEDLVARCKHMVEAGALLPPPPAHPTSKHQPLGQHDLCAAESTCDVAARSTPSQQTRQRRLERAQKSMRHGRWCKQGAARMCSVCSAVHAPWCRPDLWSSVDAIGALPREQPLWRSARRGAGRRRRGARPRQGGLPGGVHQRGGPIGASLPHRLQVGPSTGSPHSDDWGAAQPVLLHHARRTSRVVRTLMPCCLRTFANTRSEAKIRGAFNVGYIEP